MLFGSSFWDSSGFSRISFISVGTELFSKMNPRTLVQIICRNVLEAGLQGRCTYQLVWHRLATADEDRF
jgi:hypothetical protein